MKPSERARWERNLNDGMLSPREAVSAGIDWRPRAVGTGVRRWLVIQALVDCRCRQGAARLQLVGNDRARLYDQGPGSITHFHTKRAGKLRLAAPYLSP